MPSTRTPKILFLLILVFALGDCVHYFPLLPDRMASHFGANGMPNGWMTETQFFIVYAIFVGVAAFIGFIVPTRLSETSAAKLNLPNKDYWLAPERRAETFASLEMYLAWFACGVLLLQVSAMHTVMQADLHEPQRLPTAGILFPIAGFTVFTLAWLVLLRRRFAKPS
jgi:uncharacterized membrane protein